MKWWAMAIVTCLVYLAMTVGVYGAYDPTPLIMEEKFELWKYEYVTDGYKVICHYIKNPKLLSGKVNTGISCVAIPLPPPEVKKNDPEP